jgi:hypothetical protein
MLKDIHEKKKVEGKIKIKTNKLPIKDNKINKNKGTHLHLNRRNDAQMKAAFENCREESLSWLELRFEMVRASRDAIPTNWIVRVILQVEMTEK